MNDTRPTERSIRNELQSAEASDGQSPALEGFVFLRGMPHPIQGALAETSYGGLRMLSVVGKDRDGTPIMVEQFFDYDDVLVFGLQRATKLEAPLIITPRD